MNGILYMNVSILENQQLFDKCLSLVSAERKDKVLKLKHPAPARLSLGAGILQRIAFEKCGFGNCLNDIEYGDHGKPYLKESNFHFSLSHSGEYAICIYGDAPMGVDIQRIKTAIPKHTGKILSDAENNYLEMLDDIKKNVAFYEIWSRKESLIKWDGRGMRISLPEISTVNNKIMTQEVLFEEKKCYFTGLDFLMPHYAISICCEERYKWNNITEITSNFLIKY